MKVIKTKNYRELSRIASEIVIEEVSKKPNLTIGFATGKTTKGLYRFLARAYRKKKLDLSKAKAFDLDEYYPLNGNYKNSCRGQLSKRIFNKVNIPKENIRLLNGEAKDWKKECADYEKTVVKNKIDLQILGIGANGHIGFNEPGSIKSSKTRLVKLSPETLKEKRCSSDAITVGVSTIMKSKKIILLASGNKKAKAIAGLVNGKQTSNLPASFLKSHKNIIVIIDKKAGNLL